MMTEKNIFNRILSGLRQRIVLAVAGIVIGAILFSGFGNIFEHLDAQHVMVIQSPVSGRLDWYTSPGMKLQLFGTVTKYPKRAQYWFSSFPDQGEVRDQSIQVRFNDGGHATISGSVAYEIPLDEKNLTEIHQKYGSPEAIDQQLVRTVVEKSVYMTGPLMSSKESYAERRNDLIFYISDQLENGIYKTETRQVKVTDPLSGEQKTVNIVELIKNKEGMLERQDSSPLASFGVKTFNLSLNQIKYDTQVEAQIQAQQKATMDVQTAAAQAKKAEQDAITAAKNGEAEAARQKWEQEAIKAKMVTEAEMRRDVAELDRQTAERRKLEQIAIGEGEAKRRQLVMQADGALEKKLDAWVKVNERYAQALEGMSVPLVPSVVMGQGNNGSQSNNSVQSLIEMMQVKTAKDLAIDVIAPKPAHK